MSINQIGIVRDMPFPVKIEEPGTKIVQGGLIEAIRTYV